MVQKLWGGYAHGGAPPGEGMGTPPARAFALTGWHGLCRLPPGLCCAWQPASLSVRCVCQATHRILPQSIPHTGGGSHHGMQVRCQPGGWPRSDNTLKACNYDIGAWKAPGCPRTGLHRGASSTMVAQGIVAPRRIFAVASPTLSRWPPSPFLRKNVTVLSQLPQVICVTVGVEVRR